MFCLHLMVPLQQQFRTSSLWIPRDSTSSYELVRLGKYSATRLNSSLERVSPKILPHLTSLAHDLSPEIPYRDHSDQKRIVPPTPCREDHQKYYSLGEKDKKNKSPLSCCCYIGGLNPWPPVLITNIEKMERMGNWHATTAPMKRLLGCCE